MRRHRGAIRWAWARAPAQGAGSATNPKPCNGAGMRHVQASMAEFKSPPQRRHLLGAGARPAQREAACG